VTHCVRTKINVVILNEVLTFLRSYVRTKGKITTASTNYSVFVLIKNEVFHRVVENECIFILTF